MAYTAYYRLNGDGVDAMGAYHLTAYGTPTYPAGIFGNSVALYRNSSQYMSIANTLGITNGNVTLSTWVKPLTAPTAGAYNTILYKGNDANDVEYKLYYRASGTSNYLWFLRNRNNVASQGPEILYTIPTTVWTNLIMTYDGTNVVGYINGCYIGSAAAAGNGSGTTPDQFSIGFNVAAFSNCFNGFIDETIVDTAVWTNTVVRNYYNQAVGRYAPKARF